MENRFWFELDDDARVIRIGGQCKAKDLKRQDD